MKAFICVYRHPVPKRAGLRKVEKAAERQPLLRKFLAEYSQANCFYDWGDDPAFFAARELLGELRCATWGVCRRDVRTQLTRGDLVIYFCAWQDQEEWKKWDYYFIGFGTVKEAISRYQLWADSRYSVYQNFFNVLVKPLGNGWTQHEPFGSEHKDWLYRSSAPYIIFDKNELLSDFNLTNPLRVATKAGHLLIERWDFESDELVRRLEGNLFFEFAIERRLRTKSEQHAHRHIPIHSYIAEHERVQRLDTLRTELIEIARLARCR
jgi:hypothetical protein